MILKTLTHKDKKNKKENNNNNILEDRACWGATGFMKHEAEI